MLRPKDEHPSSRPAAGERTGAPAAVLLQRPASERFHTRTGWLDSRHTFSFGPHYNPEWAGFRDLVVINDDRVAPARGFDMHRHDDMEIISVVLEGRLEHKDSLGNGSVMAPGDVQLMSAGTGVAHGEWNPSPVEPVHFLQIWVHPEQRGLAPSYQQKRFDEGERRGRLRPILARDGREGALAIHQDTVLFATTLGEGERVEHALARGRHAWLHVVRGDVRVNGETLGEGDGVAMGPHGSLEIVGGAAATAEVLLFDLA